VSRLDDVAEALSYFLPTARPHHWIGGHGDCSESFCPKCAPQALADQRADKPGTDMWIDGGWEAHYGDSPAFCAICGELLAYTLSEYGLREELDHFEEWQTAPDRPLSSVVAYEIYAMCEAIYPREGELADRVAKIADDHVAIFRAQDPYIWVAVSTLRPSQEG